MRSHAVGSGKFGGSLSSEENYENNAKNVALRMLQHTHVKRVKAFLSSRIASGEASCRRTMREP